jgi:hypothetical protein
METSVRNPLPVAKFIVPDSTTTLCRSQLYIPPSGTMNLATEFHGSIAMYSYHGVP